MERQVGGYSRARSTVGYPEPRSEVDIRPIVPMAAK